MDEVPHIEFTISPREQLLMKIKNGSNFQWSPSPVRLTNHLDKTKYCHYHHLHGHRTNQCKSLRCYLEELVRQEGLQQYVKNQLVQPPSTTDKERKRELEVEDGAPPIIYVIDNTTSSRA